MVKDAKQIVAEIGRLCDHYQLPQTHEGAHSAVFKALFEGLLKIPAKLPKRGRGQPRFKYGTTLADWLAGREVRPPPRPKWGYPESAKLLNDIKHI
jgi:hypothetical protein